MPHPAYTKRSGHQQLRTQLLAELAITGPWPCPRCKRPMVVGMSLDLGHSDPALKLAGLPGDRLEHSRCNRGKRGDRKPRQPRVW